MKRVVPLLIFLVLGGSLSAKDKKPKQEIPDEILLGRYVAVVVYSLRDADTKRMNVETIEDRRAVVDVENAIRKWSRYIITIDPNHADFVIAVRTGRSAMVRVGGAGIPSGGPAIGLGQEVGPAEDMLAVYRRDTFSRGTNLDAPPAWRVLRAGGLQAPALSAFEAFKKAVEESDKVSKNRPPRP